MNILFIAPNYLPHIGGVEKHIYELTKELILDNNKVTIVVPKMDNSYLSYEKFTSLEIYRINKLSNKVFNRLNNMFFFIKNFKFILQNDIIHFHDYMTFWTFGFISYPIIKILKKNIYITFHGWEGDYPPKKSLIIKRKIIEKLVDANICIGHFIEKWYGTKANIISYGGVRICQNDAKLREDSIVFIGRLTEDSGIRSYIKAWEQIDYNKHPLQLLVCGDGVLREELEEYVMKNKIHNISFEGFVQNPQSYLKRAKIVFTSGYLSILEAFICKKNVIAVYDNRLKKDYLTMIPDYDQMMWVTNNNIETIKASIYQALSNTSKCEKAYVYALKNSWEKVKNDYYILWGTK